MVSKSTLLRRYTLPHFGVAPATYTPLDVRTAKYRYRYLAISQLNPSARLQRSGVPFHLGINNLHTLINQQSCFYTSVALKQC